jgi:tetratricopeptide (TPR) repeat protein
MMMSASAFIPQRKHLAAACAVIALSLFALYASSLSSPFIFDDFRSIQANPHIRIHDLSPAALADAAFGSPLPTRPVANLSFALDYYFSGLDPAAFRLVNVAVHAAAAVTLFLLFLQALTGPALAVDGRTAFRTAFAAAMLWAASPLATNSVTYIVQRMTSMAAMFSFASLYFYLRFRAAARGRAAWLALAAAAMLMAFASKENAYMLPVCAVGLEFFFLARREDRGRIAAAAAAAVLFLAGAAAVILGPDLVGAILKGYGGRDFTLGQRLMTEARVLFHYLGLLVWPLPGRFNLAYDYPLSTGILSPPGTLFAILGVMALAAAVPLLFNRQRLWAFAVFWFLVNLVIESTVIPLELVFEHRLYLPSAFLFLAAAVTAARLARRPAPAVAAAAVLVVLLSLSTLARNRVWASESSLWLDVTRKSPNLARAWVNLGLARVREGDQWGAIEAGRKAVALRPGSREAAEAWLNMGSAYQKLGMRRQALAAFRRVIAISKSRVRKAEAWSNIAYTHIRMRMAAAAVEEARRAAELDPHSPDAWLNLGVASGLLGRHRESEAALRRGISVAPLDARLYMWLAVALEPQGRYREAIAALDRARRLVTPGDVNIPRIERFRREILAKAGGRGA